MPVIRVGFVWPALGWMGGVNYFRSLFSAFNAYGEGNIKFIFFTGKHSETYGLEEFVDVVRTPLLDKKSLPWLISKSIKVTMRGRELPLKMLLDKHKVDVISHYNWLWKGCDIKSVAWIPDFQVLHLADCFPERERGQTITFMQQTIKKSDAIVLSSENAQSDLEFFCEHYLDGKVPNNHVLHFPSSFSGTLKSLPSIEVLRQKYRIPDEPWFHVPNQFWMHKNHTIIVQALNKLNKEGKAPLILATGKPEDPRNLNYVSELKEQLKLAGLDERFRIMGEISYTDMMGLMLYSVAVINPSRFEGWSTTVEEAKAFGKKVILSDIGVHREQSPSRGVFCGVDDDKLLASILRDSVEGYDYEKESNISTQAFFNKENRMKEFAKSYESLIKHLIQDVSP